MLLQLAARWFSHLFCRKNLRSFVSPLVVALECLGHEQLPEVLRGELLHVLAVVVNLPCWRIATCVHTPPHTQTHARIRPVRICTQTHTSICTNANMRRRGGEKKAAKQQISGERSKRSGQIVVGRGVEGESWKSSNSRGKKRGGWAGDSANKL